MTYFSDFLIIGGGISGLLTARELVLAGQQVTVLDQSAIGTESSWAGGGILLPIYPWRQDPAISELIINSLSRYPSLAAELHQTTGIDPEWIPCGLLICQNPDLQPAIVWCEHYQIRHETALPSQLNAFTAQFDNPLWLPEIAQARNPRLLKSLKAYLLQQGVRFIEHSIIESVTQNGRQIHSVKTQQGQLNFAELVITSGAWTSDLLKQWFPQLSAPVDIAPVRGQMLLFDAQPETLSHMVLDKDHYLIPRRDGKILAGSTVEHQGFNKITTEEAKTRLYQFATGLLPALHDYPVIEHWAGLRPGTAHGIPYIGRHPEIDNLSINAGHFRNGLVMGPASARLLSDLLLQRPTELDPQPYSIQSSHH